MYRMVALLVVFLLFGCGSSKQNGNESRKYNIGDTEKRFGDWVRVKNSNPIYPPIPYKNEEEGYVTLNFIIDVDGKAKQISVAESGPPGVFEKSAIEAQKRNMYDYVGEGDPKPSELAEQRYIFVLCMPNCKK